MFYYFYYQMYESLIFLTSIFNINFYYNLTYFLNSFLENIYLNCLLLSLIFPIFISLIMNNLFTIFFLKQELYSNLASLIVGYYNIHPFLLYLSIFFFIIIYSYINIYFIISKKINFIVVSAAFLLGGYWGAGNSVWGYFWVNDLIEQILIYLVIYSVYNLHNYNFKFKNYFFIFFLIGILISIFLLRLGLFSTRHSFFNILNLTNIIIYFNIFYSFFSTMYIKLLNFYLIGWLGIIFSLFILIYQFFKLTFKNFFIQFFHLILLILFYTWIKYSQHNFSFKSILNFQQNVIFWNEYNFQIKNCNLINKNNFFLIFCSDVNWYFMYKFIFNISIIFKYISVCFFYFFFLF